MVSISGRSPSPSNSATAIGLLSKSFQAALFVVLGLSIGQRYALDSSLTNWALVVQEEEGPSNTNQLATTPPPPPSCRSWPLEELLATSKQSIGASRDERIRDWVQLLKDAVSKESTALRGTTAAAAAAATPPRLKGAEVGVFEGEFAQQMLQQLHANSMLEEYILVDPWKHLDDWNKPYNKQDKEFNAIYNKAMDRTKNNPNYGHLVTVLRDTSYDAAQKVPDKSLDFVYIDGDHTAKGAMMDLLLWAPKVKCGGLVFGDDYVDSFQRGNDFDPTMVKSAVKAYVEANNLNLHEVGKDQFAFVVR